MDCVECFAPAKINLALHVVGQAENGYHLLDTIVAFADFGDLLRVSIDNTAFDGSRFSIRGPFAGQLKEEPRNLVEVALRALRTATGKTDLPALSVQLEKHLPVAAGLAGGSADAAAALRAARRLWRLSDDIDLAGIARQVGADVPMCLMSRFARAQGIGERIVPMRSTEDYPAVLVNPGIAVPTSSVFGLLRAKANAPLEIGRADRLSVQALRSMRNDLQPSAISLVPEIGDTIRLIERQPGCRLARMSGSGASCFGLFGKLTAARRARNAILAEVPGIWCVAVLLGSPDISPRIAGK